MSFLLLVSKGGVTSFAGRNEIALGVKEGLVGLSLGVNGGLLGLSLGVNGGLFGLSLGVNGGLAGLSLGVDGGLFGWSSWQVIRAEGADFLLTPFPTLRRTEETLLFSAG